MDEVGLVLLAAGYGTRLSRDIADAPAFYYLRDTPKPLLPVGGRVLVSHWVDQFSRLDNFAEIVVVTNDAHLALYEEWARTVQHPRITVHSDGTNCNEKRVGAVAGMRIGVEALSSLVSTAVIVAGDTLLPSLNTTELISEFEGADLAICAYALPDPADCVRRGMLRVKEDNVALELVEKPASVTESPSNLACAPVYLLRRQHWGTFAEFLQVHAEAPLKERDAPGFWVRWVIPRVQTRVLTVDNRIDIGGLAHYRDALARFADTGCRVGLVESLARTRKEPAVGRGYPRAGFLGNPSDGYGGKTIGLALSSEGFAEVVATPCDEFRVTRNQAHELPDKWSNIKQMSDDIHLRGVNYGARQLVLAAAASFSKVMQQASRTDEANCELTYSTTIPSRLGLAGSSALILATFRALARFHNTSLKALDHDIESWPPRILAVERELLGIAGGLMDRVAQVYQGCTFMNFSGKKPEYERLDISSLPPLWISYRSDSNVGECSGKVHSDLGQRYKAGEEDVLLGMKQLGDVAESGRLALSLPDKATELSQLFRRNFSLRLGLIGESCVGKDNMRLVRTAQEAGFAAKLCGSGGAIICVADPARELSEEEEQRSRHIFEKDGFVLRRVSVLPASDWK